jgi:hypothetical protein
MLKADKMNSQESVKDNPQDIAFRNSVVDRLSTLESDYTKRKTEKIKSAKASSIAKKNLGRGAKEIAGLGALQGFKSGLGNPTKINTRKNG